MNRRADDLYKTLDFLTVCHPLTAEIYRYWERKRGSRRLPARADIDPADLRKHLPGISIVQIVADERRYVYRLVGTREVTARGADPTGRSVSERFFGSSRERVFHNYDYVVESLSFLLDTESFVMPEGKIGNEEALFLPLASDGENVDQVLVYTHHFWNPYQRRLARESAS
jgi:hypothetical protein